MLSTKFKITCCSFAIIIFFVEKFQDGGQDGGRLLP